MAEQQEPRVRLSVDIEPELRKRLKLAAIERDMTVHEFVTTVLREALANSDHERDQAEGATWGQLSSRSFARDWESEADRVYDRLS